MNDRAIRHALGAFLIGLPVLGLVYGTASWLRFGIDLPYFDDWRDYANGTIGSFDLAVLFRPVNGTLGPIGLALDSLAIKVIDGNAIAYQAISMVTVLGTLLLLQWILLRKVFKHALTAAFCFLFTLPMLQPGSYWGEQNLAYHQALPLIFILLSLWFSVACAWKTEWRVAIVFLLSSLSGFSYISGALGAVAAGIALIFVALLLKREALYKYSWVLNGIALTTGGLITSVAQIYCALLAPAGEAQIHGLPFAKPFEEDFWWYLLGKVARSLMLPSSHAHGSLIIASLAATLLVASSVWLIWRVRRPQGFPQEHQMAAIYLPLLAFVMVYLLMVSAARANFRPVELQSATEVFTFGFLRFHFFWATLIWPWLVGVGVMVVRTRRQAEPIAWPWLTLLAGLFIASMIIAGVFRHGAYYNSTVSASRAPTSRCLEQELQRGEGIRCAEFEQINITDMAAAYAHATLLGASFVNRYPLPPVAFGSQSPPPWLRLKLNEQNSETSKLAVRSPSHPDGTSTASWTIVVGRPTEMARCVLLDIDMQQQQASSQAATLYFARIHGQPDFKPFLPQFDKDVPPTLALNHTNVRLASTTGFEDEIRLVFPQSSLKRFAAEVEIRCRLHRR